MQASYDLRCGSDREPQGLRVGLSCRGALVKSDSLLKWSPAGWRSIASRTLDHIIGDNDAQAVFFVPGTFQDDADP